MMDLKSLVPWTSRQTPAARRETSDPFGSFRREMDRLFDDFLGGYAPLARNGGWSAVVPQLDVTESDDAFTVEVELPGVDPKDVELSVTGDVLAIRGEKRADQERKDGGRYLVERAYGSFQRTLRLPFEVDAERVEASYDKGVLSVRLPKPETLKQSSRRIEIKQAA